MQLDWLRDPPPPRRDPPAPPPAPPQIGQSTLEAVPPLPLPVRPPAWEKLLAETPQAGNITVLCYSMWSGIILELLSCPEGRFYLENTGNHHKAEPEREGHGRIVHCNPTLLRAWHAKRALAPIPGSAGTHAARFRFTNLPGEPRLILPYPFQEKPQ